MTEEELQALKLKYEGKLARVQLGSYIPDNSVGIVKEILWYQYEPGNPPAVRFEDGTIWYFNCRGWTLQLHPMQGVSRD